VVNRIVCIGGDDSIRSDDVLRDVDPLLARISTIAGHQPSERIAQTLVAADVGILGYPFERFGKSGVFMSYSLAGLPVLVGDDVPADVKTFREARLLRLADPVELTDVLTDIEARVLRQQKANEQFSWYSLACTALATIGQPCSMRQHMRMAAGSVV
jgi:hypothetical protein